MKMDIESVLVSTVAEWMAKRQSELFGPSKKISIKNFKEQQKKAVNMLSQASSNGSVEVLFDNEKPIAVVVYLKPNIARGRGERVLFYEYAKPKKEKAMPWINVMLGHYGQLAPKATRLSVYPQDVPFFEPLLKQCGFNIKYEILKGVTDIALKSLIAKRNPPSDLCHLGLRLKELKNKKDIENALAIQKKVFTRIPEHGYFSHTKRQLDADRVEYLKSLKEDTGKILGVYKKNKLLGFMGGFIQIASATKEKLGGFTFCLSPEIEGLGISKTGYLLLLRYFKNKKIKSFFGGTSQPKIKSVGKILKRKVVLAQFIKG